MKTISLLACLLTAIGPLASAKDDSILARITVYWASGRGGSGGAGATGTTLHNGHCAVDPSRIPLGSHVLLPTGETLSAVDTGSAVKSRKAARVSGRTPLEKNALVIDRFFETKGQAMAWANSHPAFMSVKVVSSRVAVKEKQTTTAPAAPTAVAPAPARKVSSGRRDAS